MDYSIQKINDRIKASYLEYILKNKKDKFQYKLTPESEVTPYALCFALFGFQLLQQESLLNEHDEETYERLLTNLQILKETLKNKGEKLLTNKPYLQLLSFSLSCFAVLDFIEDSRLEGIVLEALPQDIEAFLKQIHCFTGSPGSGNLAMFTAILLIHARDYLKINTQPKIDTWCELHLENMNRFGFWGNTNCMSHLQFQNGYHQYEILDYLEVENPKLQIAADSVASLADRDGHFAPYPGGGGCYDYDAVFMLTCAGTEAIERHKDLLLKTARTIVLEQNSDGGFCESQRVRPRSLENMIRIARHILSARGATRVERMKYGLTLQRPKHNRIHTHWSKYSRQWGESDLWDSWFRMLTLARIDVAINPSQSVNWGFIDYPGIGYHSSLRSI